MKRDRIGSDWQPRPSHTPYTTDIRLKLRSLNTSSHNRLCVMREVLLNLGPSSPLNRRKIILKAPAPVLLGLNSRSRTSPFETTTEAQTSVLSSLQSIKKLPLNQARHSYNHNGITSHGRVLAMRQMSPPEQIISQ